MHMCETYTSTFLVAINRLKEKHSSHFVQGGVINRVKYSVVLEYFNTLPPC